MKKVFLESHNLKNKYSGFGQFNYHLIKALSQLDTSDFRMVLNTKKPAIWKQEFGNAFDHKKYLSIHRHKPFRIKKKYDVWHSLNQNIKIEPFYNIPYILTVHDIHFVTEGSAGIQEKLKAKFRAKLQRANAITYISEFAKKDTHAHFEVPNVPEYVIYNGNTITNIDIPKNYSASKSPKRPYLFSIGDFSPRKNFKSLVELLRNLPTYDLVLAGNDTTVYAQELRELVTKHQLTERVHLLGKIEDIEKYYHLQNCAAFVFPSLREGFGIPPIEAMRFGKPVFISNNTSLPEVGGAHAFYWDHYDPNYMADVLEKGMQKVAEKTAFYTSWYIERAKSFDWETTAKQYVEVYRSLL